MATEALENQAIHEQLGRKYEAGFVTSIESESLPPGLDEDKGKKKDKKEKKDKKDARKAKSKK